MIFREYQNNQIINKKKVIKKSFNTINPYSYKNNKIFLKNKQPDHLLSALPFKTFKSNPNNYINYTVLENNKKNNYIIKTEREIKNDSIKSNSIKFRIVNNHLDIFQKHKKLGNSSKTMINNKSYIERIYNKNNNQMKSYNNIFPKNFSGIFNTINNNNRKLETDLLYQENQKYDKTTTKSDTLNFIHYLKNKKNIIPINTRIQILKDAKYSLNQMKKNSVNTFYSYKSLFNYTDKPNSFNLSSIRNKTLKQVKPYNIISDQKPIIIKHFPKPKLTVPKFININKMNIF